MKFFNDLFKRKSQNYVPVNRLESLLGEAGHDPSKRSEFYRTLFHFPLFCLGQAIDHEDGSECARFHVGRFNNHDVVYAFTSEEALKWYVYQQKLPNQSFVGFNSFNLFEMIAGKMGLILNQGHICTKFFSPSEVSEMLRDFKTEDYAVTIPAGQSYQLGQPAEIPTDLIGGLAKYVKGSSKLREIFFGLLSNQMGEFRYLGLIDFAENISQFEESQVTQDLMSIAKETLAKGKIIDFGALKCSGFEQGIQEGALKAVSSF